jgi:hypothetical protein
MHVLLLRPVPANERFGLGPFFRIEPLGMEYIAAALEAGGHTVAVGRPSIRQAARGRHPGRAARAHRHRRHARARDRRRDCARAAGPPRRTRRDHRRRRRDFDIFFGLEAATNEGLDGLRKDATVHETRRGVEVARSLRYGVTGNFVIDPAWSEADFENLWAFVDQHQLYQAGFTILTPLPGTKYFEEVRSRVESHPWPHFDMHHLLWEPALGPQRFFELYCETWRRSVLNLRGRKSLWRWMRESDPRNLLFLLRALGRTQRMMSPGHYMAEYDLARGETRASRPEYGISGLNPRRF